MKKRKRWKMILAVSIGIIIIVFILVYMMLRPKLQAIGNFQVLEEDFYSMEYRGDYGLDRFLDGGGASSDLEAAQFVAEDMFYGIYDFDAAMEGLGCSTITAQSQEGNTLFGRNFDWGKCKTLILHTKPKSGYESIATANLGFLSFGMNLPQESIMTRILSIASIYAPLDGMNEKGLCVAILMIEDNEKVDQQTEKPDITSTTAVRLLLDRAADVEEALKLLSQYDMHASAGMALHFALADAAGNSVAVEYIDNQMIVTKADIVTNFYLAEGEKYGIGTEESHTRYEMLKSLKSKNKSLSMEQIRDALNNVSKHNFNSSFASTEWSTVFNQTKNEIVYYHRENFDKEYRFSLGG
ncbi:C45 family peptidase [Eisenbergiella porci]|uniref:C45 family peptidase n=1 Tax=Eisenbergiella porci TaxID=2652274 RepID=UPI002A828073|nr:C45 family peptidase [Eisenbergiella porci]